MSLISQQSLRGLVCTCRPTPRRSAVRSSLLPRRIQHRAALHLDAASASHSTPPPPTSTSTNKGKGVDRWPGWTAVIGLELHVQLKGNVKLLSGARAAYDAAPNAHIAPFDAALPGSLPTLGIEPVRLALNTCLALGSNVNQASKFDRKHYFYPDLPAGFQVTQKYSPIAKGGSVSVRHEDLDGRPYSFDVRIDQIQLEQDTAKSFHDPLSGQTLVDLNRAGAALVEIVTMPDMSTPEEAAAFVRSLQSILRHIGASDANMEKGELRCDINVSVQRSTPSSPMGNRCEVKNLNGVRFLVGAISSEITRQIALLSNGEIVEQATRGYDPTTNATFHLRTKEDAPDYRYMPDPELGAILISDVEYGISARDASVLVSLGEGEGVGSADVGVVYFEQVASGRDGTTAANWVIHELLGQLSKAQLTLASSPVEPAELGLLIDAVASHSITGTSAKSILGAFVTSPTTSTLRALVDAQVAATPSADAVEDLCEKVIGELKVEAEKVRQGQGKVLMRLVGEVMKRAKGTADAKRIAEILKGKLGV
ncbi:hypothetical protein RQP46_008250 [Phenoliferia psychrophenolica]